MQSYAAKLLEDIFLCFLPIRALEKAFKKQTNGQFKVYPKSLFECMYLIGQNTLKIYMQYSTGSERNPRLLEISLEIPLGVLADQQTRADWLDL